jgi:hypothetical protein
MTWVALFHMDPTVRRIDKNIAIINEMKKRKAIRNTIARIIQATWK